MAEAKSQIGLTWRTIFALLFITFVLEPAMILYLLITNVPLPLQAWLLLILWFELSRILGSQLSIQEIFVVFSLQQVTSWYFTRFFTPIKNMYIGTSIWARYFGIADIVPSWWAPGFDATQQLMLSKWIYFNPEWFAPLLVVTIPLIFEMVTDISLGYFCYGIYVLEEKLDFPAASANAEALLTLSERRPTEFRTLMISFLAGMLFNLIALTIPSFLTGSIIYGYLPADPVSGYRYLVPVPPLSYDFTPTIAQVLPGAGFDVSMNVIWYIIGFLLPIRICLAQLIGALAFYFFGTYIITNMRLWPNESPYSTSWPVWTLITQSQTYFYISVTIGLFIAAIAVPFAAHPRQTSRAFASLRSLSRSRESGVLPISLNWLLLLYLAACIGQVTLVHFLAPDFPLWIMIVYVIFGSFFVSFLGSKSSGLTYTSLTVPYQRELVIYGSGYTGKDIWFTPFSLYPGGGGMAQFFKVADACHSTHMDYVKTYIIATVLSLASGFLFINVFWNISPMPSGAWPATIGFWPIDALAWARMQNWIWTGYLFRFNLIFFSAIIGAAICLVEDFIFHFPGFLIAAVAGLTFGIGISLAQLIGSVVAEKIMVPKMGRPTFDRVKNNLVVGFTVGWGFIEMTRAALIILGKATWLLPY